MVGRHCRRDGADALTDAQLKEEPQTYSAFISYASADAEKAEAICRQLERAGFRCWIAPRDVRPGKIYLEEIICGIEASRCLVLVLSKNSNKSSFVRDEVERAYSKGKPLFPVRIEDVLPSRSLELLVSTAHWIDAWRGELDKPIQMLATRLADDADLVATLPPELQRRIRWRRRLRMGAYASAAVAIAATAGLVMRAVPQQAPRMAFTRPPMITFLGSLVGPQFPLRTRVLIQSGYDQDGMLDVFKMPVSFALFDVSKGEVKEIYRSAPGQFAGAFQTASTFDVPLPSLPLRVMACLAYTAPKTERKSAVLVGYTFSLPQSSVGTFPVNGFGPVEVRTPAEAAGCPGFAHDYATLHLQSVPALDLRLAAAARAAPVTLQCGHGGPALLNCTASGLGASTGARKVLAGFKVDDLRFVTPLDAAPANGAIRFALPALSDTVFAAVEYEDGSRADVHTIPVHDTMNLVVSPPPVVVPALGGAGPLLYVAYSSDTFPKWGMAVAAPAGTVSAAWSRDGRSFTDMTKMGGVFAAMLNPRDLGIAEPLPPPPQQTRAVFIILRGADGNVSTAQYQIDFWQLARSALRGSGQAQAMASCKEDESWRRMTLGAVQVTCTLNGAPGLLLSEAMWGTREETLQENDSAGLSLKIDDWLQEHGVNPAQRQQVMSIIRPTSYLSDHSLNDWRQCGRVPGDSKPCVGPAFVATEPVTTIYARFRYWDGTETGVIRLPVK